MNLKDELRLNLGSPSTDELSDPGAQQAVNAALLELSRFKGTVKTDYTTETEADTQDYAFPVDCIQLIDCLWGPSLYAWGTFQQTYLPSNYTQTGIAADWFENPSLRTIYQLKVAAALKAAGQSWEIVEGNKVRLIPAPAEDGEKIFLLYRTALTESSLSKYDRESLLIYAEAKARKMIMGSDAIARAGEVTEDKSTAWSIIRDLEKQFYSRVFGGGVAART